jgi:4-hydroxybenzoate polyprenyltransferase
MSRPFQKLVRDTAATLEMIKWEHSFLTLPFGLTGAVLAAHGLPRGQTLCWIVLALIAARSAAMAFNRLADAAIDRTNPRTANRAIPAGILTKSFVAAFTLASAAVLILAAWQLNPLSFYLSPAALLIVCGYSYTKRFTRWAHLFLGLAMGIAPAAAWIAVRGSFDARILLLTAAVLFWGAGFDILYSCQDYQHDLAEKLNSVPRYFGIAGALRISRLFHVVAFAFFLGMYFAFALGWAGLLGILLTGALLVYEHSLLHADDLSRMNAAFFTTNGLISLLLLAAVLADRLLAA